MKKLFFVFFFLVCSCDKHMADLPSPSSSHVTETEAFPGVVQIRSRAGSCTGVVIQKQAVMTASHCIKNTESVSVIGEMGTILTEKIEKLGPGTVGDAHDLAILILSLSPSARAYPIGAHISVGETVHLVGYGCGTFGAVASQGVKRSGTNVIFRVDKYLEVLTPDVLLPRRKILGPNNRAGSCSGDSGGPMFVERQGRLELVGIDHAVMPEGKDQISAYIDLTSSTNREFLQRVGKTYSLNLDGV